MIYGYSVVVQIVEDGEGDRRWRALVIRDADHDELKPSSWHGYGATEKAAVLAAFEAVDYKPEPTA